MTIFGMMRIRNESRWIRDSLGSILPLCERVFVLDDGSSDGTPEICEKLSMQVTVIRSPFREPVDMGIDETRDKSFLLQRVMDCVSDIHLRGNPRSPFWCIGIDGDEILERSAYDPIRETIMHTPHHAFKLPIWYLWDSDMSIWSVKGKRRVRVDGVYGKFARPSLFRLFNRSFQFQKTPWGGNFHCSSIPQELLHCSQQIIEGAPLLHLGYQYKEDRIRKWEWYNSVDGGNEVEDRYRHCVQGDLPEIPATASLKHAGPMRFEMR